MSSNSNLIKYYIPIPKNILNLLDAIIEKDLYLNSYSLNVVYPSIKDQRQAIARAIRVCSSAGVPVEMHFRKKYISNQETHVVQEYWVMSKMAYGLVLINGNPENPLAAKMQWQLINRLI